MGQCKGTTKANQRCKITVNVSESYCRYHKHQDTQFSIHNNPITHIIAAHSHHNQAQEHVYKKGFIYVYTLTHLLDKSPQKVDWLHVSTKDQADWNPKKRMLIKIGLTQGKPQNRIAQWKRKCKFDIKIIDPYSKLHVNQAGSLTRLFSKLKLGSEKNKYEHFIPEEYGFYCKNNLGVIERKIHEDCWKKYNRGDVTCFGCVKEDGKPGIHREWFLINREELSKVFQSIDSIIDQNN